MPDNPFLTRTNERKQKVIDSKCQVCAQVHEKLTKKQKRLYREAMLDRKNITALAIVDVLAEWDVKTSETVIVNHRRGQNPHCLERLERACK